VSIILAAISASTTARPILGTAQALGRLLHADVDTVHVGTDHPDQLSLFAHAAGLRLRILHGDVAAALEHATEAPDVRLAVLGCRDQPGSTEPAGHVARALVEDTAKPVVVVPPDCTTHPDQSPMTSALVPLDGTWETTAAVGGTIDTLAGSGLEVIILHVFDPEHIPPFLDQPAHALPAWGHEFLARHARTDLELQLRSGPPGRHILDVALEAGVDLIAIGWSQDLSPGHANTVRELLARSPIPLLLSPIPAPPP
jgi:nucleotide-binding universal stress UspA family protein